MIKGSCEPSKKQDNCVINDNSQSRITNDQEEHYTQSAMINHTCTLWNDAPNTFVLICRLKMHRNTTNMALYCSEHLSAMYLSLVITSTVRQCQRATSRCYCKELLV
jgi:hypothetical protein